MKIVFTTSGDGPDAPLDDRFGRAPKFLVYDLDGDTWDLLDNAQNLGASQGAGIQAAEAVVRAGARAVVTGHCGPKAFRVLAAAGVTVYNTEVATVSAALVEFRAGHLVPAHGADVEGHWA